MAITPLPPDIHESHSLVEDPPNGYCCLDCMGCTCHARDILQAPCTKELTVAS